MELKDIISVAGVGGLKRIVKQRADGLILSDMDGSGKKFMSNRIHMFTPLENISIYTTADSEPLASVLWKMKQVVATNPAPSPKASVEELRSFMEKVLPEYDRDQVFISDIKKLIKWYELLEQYDLIKDPAEAAKEEGQEEASAEETEPKED